MIRKVVAHDCRILILARKPGMPRPKGGHYRLVSEPRLGSWIRFLAISKKVAECLIAGGMPYDDERGK